MELSWPNASPSNDPCSKLAFERAVPMTPPSSLKALALMSIGPESVHLCVHNSNMLDAAIVLMLGC